MSNEQTSPVSERTPSDAPVWLDADEANAWADGYNAAIEAFRLAQRQQQPVAWRWRMKGSYRWEYADDEPKGPSVHLFDVQALYADSSTDRASDCKADMYALWCDICNCHPSKCSRSSSSTDRKAGT